MVKTTNVHGGNVHKASRLLHTSLDQILDFSANINPLGMSSKGLDAVKDALQDVIHYPDPDMTHLYSITSELWNIPKECIVFGNGAAELIYAKVFMCQPQDFPNTVMVLSLVVYPL